MTVNDVWYPTELFHCFQYTTNVEDRTVIVILVFVSIIIVDSMLSLEEIFIVNEVYLHAGCLNGCYLYDQRVIGIINDEIHTRKPDYFVQLVAAFVNATELGHESPNFTTALLYALWQVSAYRCNL